MANMACVRFSRSIASSVVGVDFKTSDFALIVHDNVDPYLLIGLVFIVNIGQADLRTRPTTPLATTQFCALCSD